MDNDLFMTLVLLGFIFFVAAELPLGRFGHGRLILLVLSLVCFLVDLLLIWVH